MVTGRGPRSSSEMWASASLANLAVRSTASKALTPSTLPTAHHVTQSDC